MKWLLLISLLMASSAYAQAPDSLENRTTDMQAPLVMETADGAAVVFYYWHPDGREAYHIYHLNQPRVTWWRLSGTCYAGTHEDRYAQKASCEVFLRWDKLRIEALVR